MMIDLPYVQSRKNHFRYRRKVPAELRDALGKTEIIIPLGRTEAEVIKRWPKAHAEAERRLTTATKPRTRGTADDATELELFREADKQVRKWGLARDWNVEELDPEDDDFFDDDELISRFKRAKAISDKYPRDDRGLPVGISAKDAALLHVLGLGAAATPPEATLEDARKFYLKEKVEGTPDEIAKTQRIDRVVGHIRTALGGRDPVLARLTRADAREVRDHMLNDAGIKPATVHRYLNDVRAIINHAIEELPLPDVTNPFNKLEVKKDTLAKDDRKPFSPTQLKAARAQVLDHANEDLQRVWRILEGTGCRLAEVTGLLVSDVMLDHQNPHVDLVVHPHRRLKTDGSVRKVPLVGDALDAAREAVGAASEDPLLFPSYGRKRGSDAASAILMKHVRKVVADRKVTVHSLRHSMKDRLRLAGVEPGAIDEILGHSSGKVSERYGGDEARLEVITAAMKKSIAKSI